MFRQEMAISSYQRYWSWTRQVAVDPAPFSSYIRPTSCTATTSIPEKRCVLLVVEETPSTRSCTHTHTHMRERILHMALQHVNVMGSCKTQTMTRRKLVPRALL